MPDEKDIDASNFIYPPKCKSNESRRAAFSLLQTIYSKSNGEGSVKDMIDYLKSYYLSQAYWRGKNI